MLDKDQTKVKSSPLHQVYVSNDSFTLPKKFIIEIVDTEEFELEEWL